MGGSISQVDYGSEALKAEKPTSAAGNLKT
jgi:hypothetical protein